MRSCSDDQFEAAWYLARLLAKLDVCYWHPVQMKRITSRGILENSGEIRFVNDGRGPGYDRMRQELG